MLTSLNPNSTLAGSPGFVLSVYGSNFISDSKVYWNGTQRATTFVSATELSALITAADVATAGTATVTVVNPAPGGGASNPLTFSITPPPASYTISGQVIPGGNNGLSGVTMTLSGSQNGLTTTDISGQYSFTGLAAGGNYTVTPARHNYSFNPQSLSFNNLSGNQTGNFNGMRIGPPLSSNNVFDFDGDGRTDTVVFRPSNGYWYIIDSSNGGFRAVQFGQAGDLPAAGDYDGDGKWDVAVFRPSAGTFYILQSTNHALRLDQFGTHGDVPVPSAYVP